MRLFHLILDGYHPDNKVDFFDGFKEILPGKKAIFSSTYQGQKILNSSVQWPLIYSGQTLEGISRWDINDPTTMSIKRKYQTLEKRDFIWNQLAKKELSSLVFPYGSFASIFFDNLLTEKSKEYCTMMIRRWGRPSFFLQDRGSARRLQSDYTYWGLHEVGDTIDLSLTDDLKRQIMGCWESEDLKISESLLSELKSLYLPAYREKLSENLKVIKEEFLPLLNQQDYVHLGLVETDTIYHYASIYPEAIQLIREYISEILQTVKSQYQPDCIIIHGDHNMVPISQEITEVFPDKKVLKLSYNGKEYNCIRSRTGYSPIYHEHGNKVGGIIWSKNEKLFELFIQLLDVVDSITAIRVFIPIVSQLKG